ncbi:branched-chain amino acid ABC transporter permease [Geobacter sp. DSM 9736]|uniref:branched-chain amino acid ABC transporter permease n=1 Tax=Geobacter sp. DSM 9736 TaxID=1277350 RepID=UPI000B51369E|nr:branched-chain amino acid ABC transporter permease [Geobacter sp. DSM 9736]SNB46830.1 amino acid/amide ABC transporter membrane protein 1, HAAT family [Geobacter sp. DSM 9736]
MFLQHLLNGVTIGGSYALIALGYTLVYGVLKLINFAHGEIYMVGAYLGFILISLLPAMPPAVQGNMLIVLVSVLVSAAVLCALYGYYLERICYRPLRNAPKLAPLISALGASIFLQNFVMITMGAKDKIFPQTMGMKTITAGGVSFTGLQVAIILSSVLLMLLLYWFINRTRLGIAIKATSTDPYMASLLGINVDTVISVTFMAGSFLAACAGVMIGLYYGTINFSIGYLGGIKAFTAAVLGGIGSVPGAMVGGFLLGIIEALGAGYFSVEYKDVYAFFILIAVLVFRPSGLLGKGASERA